MIFEETGKWYYLKANRSWVNDVTPIHVDEIHFAYLSSFLEFSDIPHRPSNWMLFWWALLSGDLALPSIPVMLIRLMSMKSTYDTYSWIEIDNILSSTLPATSFPLLHDHDQVGSLCPHRDSSWPSLVDNVDCHLLRLQKNLLLLQWTKMTT